MRPCAGVTCEETSRWGHDPLGHGRRLRQHGRVQRGGRVLVRRAFGAAASAVRGQGRTHHDRPRGSRIDRAAAAGGTALRPVRHGVITDLHTARSYLRAVVRQILPRPWQRARIQPYSAASYRLTTAPTEVGAPPAHTDQPIGPGCDKGVQPDVHRSSRNTLGHRLEEIGASAATSPEQRRRNSTRLSGRSGTTTRRVRRRGLVTGESGRSSSGLQGGQAPGRATPRWNPTPGTLSRQKIK